MVTLVSFLLTIFTKFRQLKTNLQALCCLIERIKKGKSTIKVTAEVFSRGLLWAPAEPWTEAPAGATGVPQAGSAGWQRLRWTHSTSDREPAAGAAQHQPETTQHQVPKGLQRQGAKFPSGGTHTVTPPTAPATGLMGRFCDPLPFFWEKSLHPGKCSQENKKRQKEGTDILYGIWLFLDKRVTFI